jgi:signal transduction histidine kinase
MGAGRERQVPFPTNVHRMRAQLRHPTVLFALGYLLGALVIADQWLGLGSGSTKITVTVAISVLLILAALIQWLAVSARSRADAAAAAAATERSRIAAEIHATITERIHAVVVEVVAAQQAVVRAAFVDDILTRLSAADDNAHAALACLDLLLATPEESEPAGTQQSVAIA